MKRITRGQAIKNKCKDCMCGNTNEVKLCPSKDCPLWSFRRGKEESSSNVLLEEDEP